MSKIDSSTWLKCWKVVAVISAILFLYLFIGYEYEQISWNLYRYSFARDGYAVKVDKQLAVGVERIIRSEDAFKILQKTYPDQEAPEDGKEYVLLNVKVKNISRKKAKPWSMEVWFLETKDQNGILDGGLSMNIDLPAIGTYKKLGKFTDLAPGEIREETYGYEIQKGKPLWKMQVHIERGNKYDFIDMPFSKSPWRFKNNFSLFTNYLLFTLLILNARWKKSKLFKMGEYWVFPILLITILLPTSFLSSTMDFESIGLILLFALLAWWFNLLINTTTTNSKKEESPVSIDE